MTTMSPSGDQHAGAERLRPPDGAERGEDHGADGPPQHRRLPRQLREGRRPHDRDGVRRRREPPGVPRKAQNVIRIDFASCTVTFEVGWLILAFYCTAVYCSK